MATNPYFSQGSTSEQNLVEDLIIESIQIYGKDVYYIPRALVGRDDVLMDELVARFDSAFLVEMYLSNAAGFEGEGDLFTKFGIELRDAITWVVARKRWNQAVGDLAQKDSSEVNRWYRPREGDLLYWPESKSTLEITEVDTEALFYQLRDLPQFTINCELYEYASEDFDTGIDDIDAVERYAGFHYQFAMPDSASGDYIVGEDITQVQDSATMTGEVIIWDSASKTLTLNNVGANTGTYNDFTVTNPIVGGTSGAKYTPTTITEIQKMEPYTGGDAFESAGLDFIDFSEQNPFGEP